MYMAGILAAMSQAYAVLDAPFIHTSAVEYKDAGEQYENVKRY
jgi:hypothetical protein